MFGTKSRASARTANQLFILVVTASALLIGCKRSEPSTKSEFEMAEAPKIEDAELNRALKACADYQKKVCAAAKKKQSLLGDCRQAESRVEAAILQSETLTAGGNDPEAFAIIRSSLGKTAKACIEDLSALSL